MENVKQTVTQLFVATDQRDWATVTNCFADRVYLDYSSLSGNPAATLSPREITTAWKAILPGFTHTHHQLGNFLVTNNGQTARVFCYGTATHYLEAENGNVWTVVDSYDFELEAQGDHWKITAMTFHFKYQDGNSALPQLAIDKVKTQ